jgi:hypothetical protein
MTRLLFLGVGLSVGLLTATVFGQGDTQTVVVEEGIDTTLAAYGLNGPDAPHGAEGTNPDGVERWEWDGADCPQGHCGEVGDENHGLLWFDIPQDVLSSFGDGQATLALYLDDAGNAGEMYRMTSDWLSGPDGGDEVTFNNIPGGPGVVPGQNTEAESNVTFPDTISLPSRWWTVFEFDVSEDVKAWAAGSPNYGWGFVPVGVNGTGIASFEHVRNPVPALTLTFVPEPLLLGDVNGDGDVNGLDVDPFVEVVLGGPYQQEADMNEDQVVNGLDVDPFVAAVVGGAQQIPEPSTLLLCIIALGVVGGWRKWGGCPRKGHIMRRLATLAVVVVAALMSPTVASG